MTVVDIQVIDTVINSNLNNHPCYVPLNCQCEGSSAAVKGKGKVRIIMKAMKNKHTN